MFLNTKKDFVKKSRGSRCASSSPLKLKSGTDCVVVYMFSKACMHVCPLAKTQMCSICILWTVARRTGNRLFYLREGWCFDR